MAARLNPHHQQLVRDKIQAIRIVEEIQKVVFQERDMSSIELRAAEILLNKSVGSIQAIEISAEVEGEITLKWEQ